VADLLLVDGDGHTVEPKDLWTSRMNARRWGDWIPRYDVDEDGVETFWVGGEVRAGGRELTERLAAEFGMTLAEWRAMLDSLDRPGGYDPDARVADLDVEGIAAAVVYPTLSLFYGPVDEIEALRDPEFVLDCQRAYNDWVAEFCGARPRRLFGVAAVPLQDVDAAVREAERAVGKLGLKGVFIRPSPYVDELPFSHPVYDRFWAACQDLDVPVGLHPGVHVDTPGACRKLGLTHVDKNTTISNLMVDPLHGGCALGQAVGNTVDMIVAMGRLLMGGVCERFPRLRLLFLEAGGGWVPTQLERMDEQVKAFPLERRWLSLLPSEYFARQCWVSFEPGEWNLAACAGVLGAERILWASDYPHPDIPFPGAARELRESISRLPAAQQRQIAGGSAIAAYKLPL
jgi:predicted TIM-barrel fold metal-dependent hydrolase